MENNELNISVEDVTRPLARVMAREFVQASATSVADRGCFLSTGTDINILRDSLDTDSIGG